MVLGTGSRTGKQSDAPSHLEGKWLCEPAGKGVRAWRPELRAGMKDGSHGALVEALALRGCRFSSAAEGDSEMREASWLLEQSWESDTKWSKT